MSKARNEKANAPKIKLTRAERKQLQQLVEKHKKPKHPQTAQQSIPYHRMYPDGVCRVTDKLYSKTVQFYDINYQQATDDDKNAIFGNWSNIYNFFQPGLHVQWTFPGNRVNEAEFRQSLIIDPQDDGHNDKREEMTGILMGQVEKGNNAIERTKYVTIALEADNAKTAKTRLEQTELQLII